MFSFQTVFSDTMELLKGLMRLPVLSETRLVGGTALALQYGHRRSVDLDFFGFATEDFDEVTQILKSNFKSVTQISCTKRIKIYSINDIKVDIVNYDYPWLENCIEEDGIRLASVKDIAAMKVNAIIGRGTKKDFVDIYILLQHFSFEELMQLYLKKYTDGSEYRALLSMSYFEDADPQPMPYMFEQADWDKMKKVIRAEVERYNGRHI
ncbi:MAG: nucleotidyl transferase AbiEii/AbiGii toxin family protein [Bacteroidales bacterium]|nr:nucleotidyl transferase AbiEii/AbiGii toxin family protein [Bacteroidales bacterium]